MYVYVICPVRHATEEQIVTVSDYVVWLECKGHTVYLPYRDAPQNESETGYEIIESEFEAIRRADEIHVFWDVTSGGSHFDLGLAYALNKPIHFVYMFAPDTPGKSYVKVIERYMEENHK